MTATPAGAASFHRRSLRSARCVALGMAAWPASLVAQMPDSVAGPATPPHPVVLLRDAGPGSSGRLLRAVLSTPHVVRIGAPDGDAPVALRRDTTYETSVVVLGKAATVGSTIHGDVVVVGGDLFLHPGAVVDGRAIAIGGGVYNSTLATVRGGQLSFRDETFEIVRAEAPGGAVAGAASDTVTLRYRPLGAPPSGPVTFPLYGLHLPAYDRVDGLALPVGPSITLGSGRLQIDPTVTYRSHLGAVDPFVSGHVGLGRLTELSFRAGRTTRTNDDWNRSDFLNGLSALVAGLDARNYYRADLAEGRVTRRWEAARFEVAPFVGALTERAWSAGPDAATSSAPYSLFLRRDRRRGMLRPNPRINRGRISSALAGVNASWALQDVVASIGGRVEVPVAAVGDARFVQTTVEGEVGFPTFGSQRLDLFAHAVVTAGDTAPPQRFAYLGGEDGTIVTRDLLSLGGDQLLYVQGLYSVPLERLRLRLVGFPVVALRYAVGSAGVGALPSLEQNVGVRVSLNVLRVQYMLDPATHDSRTSLSLSLFR